MAKLNINGMVRDVPVEADTPLLWVIREQIGLTGTKYGCGIAQCGACSVHVNDEVQRSCSVPVGDVKPTDMIVTIEGLSVGSSHPPGGAFGRRRRYHRSQGLGRVAMKNMFFAKSTKLSRRKFIVGSAAVAGGGLALGLNVPFGVDAVQAQGAATEVNIWVAIKPDDTCVIRIARSEMGQGTLTGIAQLVAEELECDWNKVATEGITPGRNLASKRAWGEMGTGGSRGIRTSEDYVRRGGAAARLMLLQAAADQWNVPVGELIVSDGVITHGASKRSIRYGEVAAAAAKLTPPDPKA